MELDATLTSIAESLREERTRAGLTLEQLAQRADLSTAHLSRLESGDRQPSVAALISLARALGVSLSTLLGERRGAGHRGYPGREPDPRGQRPDHRPCSGFPGSSTLEALHITIESRPGPPQPARHRGEEWIYVVEGAAPAGVRRTGPPARAGSTVHFDANRPTGWAPRGDRRGHGRGGRRTQRLRNHPLFTSSITDH
jgi:transcriptional regulator with XRE-family HTH domain